MDSGRSTCASRWCVRAFLLALAATSILPTTSTHATECRDVRSGRNFTNPSARYTSAGAALAEASATAGLCLGAVRGARAVLIRDAAGGAFVVWIESAGTDCDLRMQRVDETGAPAAGWSEGGRTLCAAPGSQMQPAIALSGDGGVWLAWKDYRESSRSAVYLLKLDEAGAPVAGYPAEGARVSGADSPASDPVLLSDGTGGAWLIWQQGRRGSRGLRLKHFASDGGLAPGWPADGRALTGLPADATHPAASSAPGGGFALAWVVPEAGDRQLRLAVYDAAGALASGWPEAGVLLGSSPAATEPVAVMPGESGVFAAWTENFADSAAARLTKIDLAGTPAPGWPEGGLVIGGWGGASSPAFALDGAGGVYLAWIGFSGEATDLALRVSRLTAAGEAATGWTTTGQAVPATGPGTLGPRLVALEDGVLVTWTESESDNDGVVLSAAMKALGALPEIERIEKWPDLVRLSWRTNGEAHYQTFVERRAEDGEWTSIQSLASDPTGALRLEDREVVAGEVVTYRPRLVSPQLELVTGEIPIEVPAAVPLALNGLAVHDGRLHLVASVPAKGESRFELFDVQGRRLLRDIRQHEHAGEVRLDWPVPAGVRAGVFFARFSLGRESKSRRFVVGR